MKRKAFGLVVAAAVLGSVAPASAAVPTRSCSTRGEGPRPIERLARPGDLQMGPVAFSGLARVASPRTLERFRSGGRFVLKTPLFVRAGRVVTVSIARADRSAAGLTFIHAASLETGVPAVRFSACRADEPSWAHSGGVGPITAFPGGFTLARPACVDLVVRVRGRAVPYRRTVSFGMGRAATNCDKT